MTGRDDQLKGRAATDEIGRRLGSLFENLKDTLDTAARVAREAEARGGETNATRDFTVDTPVGPLSGRMGMRVRVGGLGGRGDTPSAADRAEVATPAPAPDVDLDTLPILEVFEEVDHLLVTVDLRGHPAGDVALAIEDGSLVLSVAGRPVSRMPLPAGAPAALGASDLRNGFLTWLLPLNIETRP